ncbi:MAG: hypothetical protein HYX61_07395 [Gammaproteobacteria bacterium]|jgi:hypothetical protein|nr:hypothetical protein [Gammaproteobacteria bacterium]
MRLQDRLKNLKSRNWSNYGSVVLTFVAFIAMFSHCLVGPLLLPFVSTLFPASTSAHNLCWLVTGITSLFSVTMGVLLAEKFYAQREARKEERSGSASSLLEKKTPKAASVNDPLLLSSHKNLKSMKAIVKDKDEQSQTKKSRRVSTIK